MRPAPVRSGRLPGRHNRRARDADAVRGHAAAGISRPSSGLPNAAQAAACGAVSIDDREDPSCLDPGIFESLASRSARSRQLSQDQYEREPLNAEETKRRVVPISNRIRPLLESYFAVSDRMRISSRSAQRMMKRIANRAAISRGVSPHALRHTFAVSAIQKDISLPAVQRLLGHDHLGTTEDPSQHEPKACAR